jgi:peptidoglycan/LPS O-acetylase OafA/YrhL
MLLGNYATGRDNNFQLLRLLAALTVMFSHSYVLSGRFEQEPLAGFFGMDSSHVAVNIFFVISGFLVTGSYCRSKNWLEYIEARFLRIFPGLLIAVLFCALVIGGLFTSLSLSDYYSSRQVWEFIFINSTLILDKVQLRYALPGVFPSNPNLNGSLWTLPYEVWFYILLLALGLVGTLKRKLAPLVLFGTVVCLYFYFRLVFGDQAQSQLFFSFARFGAYFFAGMVAYVYRQSIPLKLMPVILLWLGFALTRPGAPSSIFLFAALVYSVFWFAYVPAGRIRNFNKLGDYSYGIYIYAYPIQQSLVFIFKDLEPLMLFGLTLLVTLPFAMVSWHFIEKPFLERRGSLFPFAQRYGQSLKNKLTTISHSIYRIIAQR